MYIKKVSQDQNKLNCDGSNLVFFADMLHLQNTFPIFANLLSHQIRKLKDTLKAYSW